MEQNPLLKVEQVSICYHTKRGDLKAVTEASFTIGQGQSVALIGESGCGKTTLATAIVDALPMAASVTGGKILYRQGDKEVNLLEMKRKDLRILLWSEISMVFQASQSSFNPVRKIKTQFLDTVQAHDRGKSKEEILRRAAELLRVVMLDPEKVLNTVDYDKAEQLLTQAGLTKKDGQWYKADGSQFTIALQCPTSWSDGSTAATEIANQLTNFGIKTSVDGIDSTLRQSNINEGAYEVAISFFGTAQAHPMFAFETPFLISNVNCSKGLSYPMVQETECCGTVDLNAEITASTAGWDTEAQKEAVGKIVYTLNETVPILPLYTKYSKYVTSDGLRTDWGDNDALYQNSAGDDSFVVMKILSGELKSLN